MSTPPTESDSTTQLCMNNSNILGKRKLSVDERIQDIVKKSFVVVDDNSNSAGCSGIQNKSKNTEVEITESCLEHVVSEESSCDSVICTSQEITGDVKSSSLIVDLTNASENKFIPKKVTGLIDLTEEKENIKDETIFYTIEKLEDSEIIKEDPDVVAYSNFFGKSEVKCEAELDGIEDIKDETFLFSIEELEDSEIIKDDPDVIAHRNFFENPAKKHEAELDGIQVATFLNPHLVDELFPKELPNQNEIMEDLKNMRPKYRQDIHTFFEEKKATKKALDNVFVLLKQCPSESDYAPDPEGLDVPLMQHQKRALKWMLWREKKMPYGGILADDMGLGKTLSMIALILHDKNSLENEDIDSNWNLSDGGTLVICPTSLLRQWEKEIMNKTQCTALIPLVFYGDINPKDLKRLRSFDVVITTYRTVWGQRGHHLLGINWRRIVVDEAHVIRNVTTRTSESICSLRAKHRWALTGTPIHNKEEDMFALLKFLRYRPFDEKSCWATWLNDHKRLSVVVRSSMLRRTKTELMAQNTIFRLPPRHEELFEIELSEEELIVHHTVLSFSRSLFEKFLKQREERMGGAGSIAMNATWNKISNISKDCLEFLHKLQGDENHITNYVILVLILRLRQICCHPGLVQAILYDNDDNALPASDSSNEYKDVKPCSSKKENIDAVKEIDFENPPSICEILNRTNPVFDLTIPSTKMKRMMEVLNERVFKNNDKAVIVSQWGKFLNIMGDYLIKMGVRVLHFNGHMGVEDRLAALDDFHKKREAKVLLLSLTAGGVGLNLIDANHLFLMEPHWNPQMESQAQDRVYRMGQTKNTFVYRFICSNSIEERIRAIQQDKLAIAENVLTGAAALSSGRLTITDLMKLFGITQNQIIQKKN